jgi:hypothetical protein
LKAVVLFLLNYAVFSLLLMQKNTESHEVSEIEEISLRVARDWITGFRDMAVSSGSGSSVPSEKKPAP